MRADLIEGGENARRRYVIRMGQRFVLGRGLNVSVRLDDDRISRQHVALELTPDGLWVTDLGSRNGTYLSGRLLGPDQPRLAAAQDTLQMEDYVFYILLSQPDPKVERRRARVRALDAPLLARGGYQILGEIGCGATGRIYAAHQPSRRRNVAIKVLRAELDDEESRERFLREGRLCSQLRSPYVVEVHDICADHERVYLVMELIDGLSAKDRVDTSGPLPVAECLAVGEDVAAGLVAAHSAGVVHRDIKPANILLTPAGIAKLSDFGIAKELYSVEALTATGEGLGTFAYVSPEQAHEAREAGPSSDLYSLGATLYHLLVGYPPFIPRDVRVLMEVIHRPPPSLREARPEIPEKVAAFIHRLLAKTPEERPANAAAVRDALRALRRHYYPQYVRHRGQNTGTQPATLYGVRKDGPDLQQALAQHPFAPPPPPQ